METACHEIKFDELMAKKIKILAEWKPPVMKSNLMNCNHLPSLQSCTLSQIIVSVLLCRILLSNLVVHLVAFSDITWK